MLKPVFYVLLGCSVRRLFDNLSQKYLGTEILISFLWRFAFLVCHSPIQTLLHITNRLLFQRSLAVGSQLLADLWEVGDLVSWWAVIVSPAHRENSCAITGRLRSVFLILHIG